MLLLFSLVHSFFLCLLKFGLEVPSVYMVNTFHLVGPLICAAQCAPGKLA